MLISLNWLREYVDFDVDPAQLADDLTMAGLNVEGVEHRPNPFGDLRVGRVIKCDKHPNADKLSVCQVDIGEEELRTIVCGAPNVKAGLEVAVIPSGSCLPDGTLIKKGKLRGVVSLGMICSQRELGLSEDHDGIWEMDLGVTPGTPLSESHGVEDWILDIEVTPNRPDQLGYLGIAREVAALYGTDFRLPDITIPADSLAEMSPVPVRIDYTQGCSRYIARRLSNIQVGPSPEWLCRRLESVELRPLNNVVDVTNFVLFETGHPLHAFDAGKISGGEIIVREAIQGEKTLTLEDKEALLVNGDVVIADNKGCLAIGGIMGCDNSKVETETSELILESAVFDQSVIRKTRSRLDISTDSSYRFERGSDFEMAPFASARAAQLLAGIAGAQVSTVVDDIIALESEPIVIDLRLQRVNGLLGTDLSPDQVAEYLQRFQLPCKVEGGVIRVDVPRFRRDLHLEEDLIEEVARLYGYNNVPTENRISNTLHARISLPERVETRLHGLMTGTGFTEIMTSSFMDEKSLDLMGLPPEDSRRKLVTIRNPLVSFNSKLRSSLLPGMLDVVKTNFHRGQEELRLYQIGRTYLEITGEKLPLEDKYLSVLVTGSATPPHWSGKGQPVSLSDLSGLVDLISDEFGVKFQRNYSSDSPYLVPGVAFELVNNGKVVGECGAIRPSLLSDCKQKRDVFYLDLLRSALDIKSEPKYRAIPTYPASRRDLALLVPTTVHWHTLTAEMEKCGGKWLESSELFDVYKGEGIPEGSVSCAIRLVFRSEAGTLTDKQVDKQLKRILGQLEHKLGVSLRA
jgi:phenylalanyl-tRNA synthetase beta chain